MMELRARFAADGVVLLKNVLDASALADAQSAFDWSFEHPGPMASSIAQSNDSLFYQDLYNPGCATAYAPMLRTSPLPALIADIWGAKDVWFMYEQVFLKQGGETRRTPWHQDSSYLTIAGEHLAVAWISFDPVEAQNSLEFVRSSHRGPLYNGSSFELGDDTAPLYGNSAMPRLPEVEAARSRFDIMTWPVDPGDVILFHPAMLHGGAPTHPGGRRRTLTLRFFGTDARYESRPGRAGPRVEGLHEALKTGDPFRGEGFLKLL